MTGIGVFTKTFERDSAKDVLLAVKNYGFEVAHFNFASVGLEAMPEDIPPAVIQEIRSAIDETSIRLVGVSATFNMAYPDPKVREEGIRRFKKIATVCPELQVPLISLCSGSRNRQDKWAFHPDNETSAAWTDMVRVMEALVMVAEQNDIYLGIEPELANIVSSPLKAFELINEMQTDRIKIILDPANLSEKSLPDQIKSIILSALDLLHPFLAMAHAKDRTNSGNFAPPGKGVIPFEFMLNAFAERNLDIPLVAHGFSEKEATGVANYLKSINE